MKPRNVPLEWGLLIMVTFQINQFPWIIMPLFQALFGADGAFVTATSKHWAFVPWGSLWLPHFSWYVLKYTVSLWFIGASVTKSLLRMVVVYYHSSKITLTHFLYLLVVVFFLFALISAICRRSKSDLITIFRTQENLLEILSNKPAC